jgi:hypothetical protein
MLTAELFPFGHSRYNVIFDGDLIVEASRDPECDLARALKLRGYTGKVTMLDGWTRKPRTIINIEKASKLMAVEGPHGPRFIKYQVQTVSEASHSPLSASLGMEGG